MPELCTNESTHASEDTRIRVTPVYSLPNRLPSMPVNGKKVRELREGLRLSQTKLGGMVGVSQSTIARWEGDASGLTAEEERALARALKTSVAYLRDEADGPTPDGTTIERETGPGPPDEFTSQLERELFGVMDPRRHDPEDFDAARDAIRETGRDMDPNADRKALALLLLESARQLRLAPRPVTVASVLARASSGKTPRAEQLAADRDEAFVDEVDAGLRARGREPGDRAEALKGLGKKPG
jgi:transcriptional regulator with XRE-family HTH domain